jgi:hypothetical protein
VSRFADPLIYEGLQGFWPMMFDRSRATRTGMDCVGKITAATTNLARIALDLIWTTF